MSKSNVMDNLNLRTGDLVIGTRDPSKSVYSAEGKKLVDGGIAIVGDAEEIAQLQNQIKKAAKQSGKQITEEKKAKKKTGRKANNTTNYISLPKESPNYLPDLSTYSQPIEKFYDEAEAEKPKPQQVYFENAFGKIRSSVESVIEHEAAFMLVFSNEEEIVFEPKVGETLVFTYNKKVYSVYYPGVIFDWTDGIKKAMILFKASEENE